MFYHKRAKKVFGGRVASVALTSWGLLGFLGPAAALADKPQPPPPPPQPAADPAIAFMHTVTVRHSSTRYLAVCNADGTNVTDLVALNALLSNGLLDRASWAPDGHSIAFSVNPAGGGSGAIWRIDVSVANGVPVGSNLRQLATGYFEGVDWSPLGNTIAYSDSGRIYTIPAAGGTPQLIHYGPMPSRYPRFSPDGNRIAFVYPYTTSYVKVIDLSTSVVTTAATLVDSMPRSLDWGHTSDMLSYIEGGLNAVPHINLVNVVTGERTVLAPTANTYYGGASFSPDDSQLVYQPSGASNLTIYTLSTGAITTLPAVGSCPEWRRNP